MSCRHRVGDLLMFTPWGGARHELVIITRVRCRSRACIFTRSHYHFVSADGISRAGNGFTVGSQWDEESVLLSRAEP